MERCRSATRFAPADSAPAQIVNDLLEKGIYIASESTFYRILRKNRQLHHRGRTAAPVKRDPTTHKAHGPNQPWSWDITYLCGPAKGLFYYLYLIVDLYSRKIVGWEIYHEESGELASEVVTKAVLSEKICLGDKPDMRLILWKKFMLNVGINQTSAVLRFPYGLIQKIDSDRAVATAAMKEVVSLAVFEKVKLTEDDVKNAFSRIDTFSPDGKTPMLQDVESSRPTEVGMLGETVVELGRVHGVAVPVNEMLSFLIRAIEESYVK